MKLVRVAEGKAVVLVPEQSLSSPFHCKVFYNPAMAFNRSVSSLALGAALELLDGSTVVDGLAATGVRGIRYAAENGLEKIFFVDANPDAVKVLERNVKLNKLENAVVVEDDFNKFLACSRQRFDFIEIDPFGCPVPFLEGAVRKLKRNAVLSVTATDLANLSGARPLPCMRHYDAAPLHSDYLHEVAARILVGRIARTAMAYDFAARPLLTFYERHYVKAIVLLEESASKANGSLGSLGLISHCFACLNRVQGYSGKCSCGRKMKQGGSLWLGELSDAAFVKRMRVANKDKRVDRMLSLIEGEQGFPPWFFDVHVLSDKLGLEVKGTQDVLSALREKGFKAAGTHFTGKGIKTDAGIKDVASALK